MRLDPDAALGALIALLIGWTMVFAGTRKRALHFRNRRRRCPSCGHAIPGRVCERHQ